MHDQVGVERKEADQEGARPDGPVPGKPHEAEQAQRQQRHVQVAEKQHILPLEQAHQGVLQEVVARLVGVGLDRIQHSLIRGRGRPIRRSSLAAVDDPETEALVRADALEVDHQVARRHTR